MRDQSSANARYRRRFSSRRAYRRWLKRQGGQPSASPSAQPELRAGLESLEQRTLLSAAPTFELSDLLAGNGGDGSQGVVINGVSLGDRAGISVSSAGDINGDGFDDIIIGAFRDAPNGADSGASFVVFGKAGGFNATQQLSSLNGVNGFKINGISAGDFSGRSVASAGDINNDGFDDLLISSFLASPNGAESGQVYVVYGKASGYSATLELSSLNGTNGFSIDGLAAGDRLGFSVRGAGDVNADGIDDFILGSSLANAAAGQAYVVFGQNGGFGSSFDLATLNGSSGFTINGVSADDELGIAVNGAGDVNGDGIGDLIVGAYRDDPNGIDSGAAFVIFGATSGFGATFNPATLNGTNGFILNGGAAGDNAGRAVASAGDFNGDGFADVFIGAPDANGSTTDSGAGYVVYGKSGAFSASINLSTLNGANGFKLNGIDTGDRTGLALAAAGDVNGDGLDDLLIAADRANPNGTRSGETYLVLGRSTATPASINLSALTGADGFVLNGINAQDSSGTSVRSAGDVNGDGLDDFLIGAFLADPNGGESGETYLIFGDDFSDAITHRGTDLNDALAGDSSANVIIGGQNDDTLTGNGGADVLLGGEGDDEIVISDNTFRRVGGGHGSDTLKLAGAAFTLDLTAIADSRLTGIEAIDLSGAAHTVTLNLREVLNISGDSNTLRLIKDDFGTINIGSGWTQISQETANGNLETTYTQANATLVIVDIADIIDPVVTIDPLTTTTRSPELTGSVSDNVDPNVTVEVTVNGTTYNATNNGDGTWTLPAGTISPDLADGVYDVLVTATDASNNTAIDQTSNELLIDNAAPVVTIDTLYVNSDSPQLTGTIDDADPATSISVTVDGNTYPATNNGDGTWTLPAGQISPALSDAVYQVNVTATDTLGNIGSDASTDELTIDTTVPIVAIDTPSPTDNTSPELTGTIDDFDLSAEVEVFVNGVTYQAVNLGDGTWVLPAGTIDPPLTENTYTVDARATDAAGNTALAATTVNLVIDTAPVVTVDSLTTSDQRPQLTGTIQDATATIEVTVNGITYNATNNANGTWTLADDTITPALADGTYDVSVTATDAGNNVGVDATTDELIIDTSTPIVTIDTLSTQDSTPQLTGTVSDPSATIQITVGGNNYAAINNGDGTWTLPDNTIAPALGQGLHDVIAIATNLAETPGVGFDNTTNELRIDTVRPVVTFNTLTTADTSPELTGTVIDADTQTMVTVTIDGNTYQAERFGATGNGTWVLADNTIAPPLAIGSYDVLVTATDTAGNVRVETFVGGLTITEAPFSITIDPLVTNDTTPELTGTIDDPAATVEITVNGIAYAATNNGDGTWTLADNTIAPLTDGVYDVQAAGTNADPVTIFDQTTNELTIDSTAPTITVNALTTSDTTPQLTGTIDDPAATIEVTVNGNAFTATNNGDGTWTLADNAITPALTVNTYDVQVAATDAVGNVGNDATIDELIITPPTISTIDLDDLHQANGGDGSEGVVYNGVAGGDWAGNAASSAGDINGDGFDDIIIGANNADPLDNNDGTVYVVFGQASGFPAELDLSTLNGTNGFAIHALNSRDSLGVSVASAGDVNGDGLDDIIIGADLADPNGNRSGTAYVVYGSTAPFSATFDLSTLNGANGFRFNGEAGNDRAGFSVSGAGDVNGDGLADVIIGSLSGDDGVTLDTGRAYVILGSTAAMPAVLTAAALTGANGFTLTGTDTGDNAGFSVSSAGDINGDGLADMRVGAPGATVGANTNAGKTYIVFGTDAGFAADLNLGSLNGANGFVIEGDTADMDLGFSGSNIGDINGDGFDDVLVSAPANNDVNSAGSAYVIFGSSAPFAASISVGSLNGANGFAINGVDNEDLTGFNVSGVGDANGDGFDDFIIGAQMADGGTFENGESFLVFGHAGPYAASLDLATLPGNGSILINGAGVLDHSGRYVSRAGDINGDGFADILIGVRDADVNGNNDAGRVYVIFGRDFLGSVTHIGGETGETLTGSASRDAIIAGAGDDELIGNGGPDIQSAGQGDDTLAVSDAAFKRVTGGNGFDTLRIDGAGVNLDLTTLSDSRLTGIEQIDVRGTGANSLTLNLREVLNISDTSNTLLILADSGDTVDIGAGWTPAGQESIDGKTFDVFNQANATVKIFTESTDTTDPVVTVNPLTTTDTTPQLTGTVVDDDPLTTVEVTVNGATYNATNNGDGTWTLADDTIAALTPGTYDVSVTATDSANNTGSDATTDELVIESIQQIPGDLNGDGFVGIADLNIVLTNWNQNVTPGSLIDGDPSGDGFVGIADLNTLLGNWNAGTPPTANAIATSTPDDEPQAVAPAQSSSTESTAPATTTDAGKLSLLDEVSPATAQPQSQTSQSQASAWQWMNDTGRAQSAFADDSDSALDLARPLPDQSAVSRLP